MKGIAAAISAVMFITGLCSAGDSITAPQLTVSGRVSFESGEIVNGHFNAKVFPYRMWINREYLYVTLQSAIGNKVKIIAEPEVKIWFNEWPVENKDGDVTGVPFRQNFTVSLIQAQAIYSFWGNSDPRLSFAAGFFPVKYNPDARNLGEYLFRTGAYPPYIANSFENAYAPLSGFRLKSELFGFLQQELMLYPEMLVQPLLDWSTAYTAQIKVSAVEVGAGVSLHHWFPVVNGLTLPHNPENLYFTETGDSAWFTFKGIKLMGRLAFDPKRLLPAGIAGKFGKNDLRLYTEAALLGVTDYPAFAPKVTGTDTTWVPDTTRNYYADLLQRLPVMAGFNFPTCNLFDYCSFELESFIWPLKNTYFNQTNNSENPQPALIAPFGQYKKIEYQYDSWKWSINAKKTIVSGFSVIAQIARDHMRIDNSYESAVRDDEEALTRANEWCWMVRLQYGF